MRELLVQAVWWAASEPTLPSSGGSDRFTVIFLGILGLIGTMATVAGTVWVQRPAAELRQAKADLAARDATIADRNSTINDLKDEIDEREQFIWRLGYDPHTEQKVSPP